jgi:UDP-N-acetylmuramoylalanine--D-glutamate ligase
MEHVATRRNVTYYNDSKGTNVDAVNAALEFCEQPVVLLMGGRDKGENFGRLADSIRRKVRTLVLFGEAAPVIGNALGGLVPTTMKRTLGEAVDEALTSARRGDTVLLSPGCSSFDEFRDYRERGEFFRDRVLSAAASSKTPMREES